jgi:hypothetical protein
MPITSVITAPGIGGTFLTWSLEWLSGHDQYFYFPDNRYQSVCENPLTEINAHNYSPNQPQTLEQLRICYDILSNPDIDRHDHFVYFHNLKNQQNTYPSDPRLDQQGIDIAFEKSRKCLVLDLPKNYFLYKISSLDRELTQKFDSQEFNQSFKEQKTDFINYFFGPDYHLWNDLELKDIWDQREFLALNLRPFDQVTINKDHLIGKQYFSINSIDCWLCLDRLMGPILEFLGLKARPDRWEHWHKIFSKWSNLHYDRIRFAWYFEEIVSAILNGIDFDLDRFNLDLYRESVIQHVLLYRYNLNLRTHNLHKFENTKQLHNLLENNIHHSLDKIY